MNSGLIKRLGCFLLGLCFISATMIFPVNHSYAEEAKEGPQAQIRIKPNPGGISEREKPHGPRSGDNKQLQPKKGQL